MTDGTWIADWGCGDCIYGVDENDLSKAMRSHECSPSLRRLVAEAFDVPLTVIGLDNA